MPSHGQTRRPGLRLPSLWLARLFAQHHKPGTAHLALALVKAEIFSGWYCLPAVMSSLCMSLLNTTLGSHPSTSWTLYYQRLRMVEDPSGAGTQHPQLHTTAGKFCKPPLGSRSQHKLGHVVPGQQRLECLRIHLDWERELLWKSEVPPQRLPLDEALFDPASTHTDELSLEQTRKTTPSTRCSG